MSSVGYTKESMVDLRAHCGRFFLLIGAILVAMGLAMPANRAPLTDANVNLWAGLSMVTFGALMLSIARK